MITKKFIFFAQSRRTGSLRGYMSFKTITSLLCVLLTAISLQAGNSIKESFSKTFEASEIDSLKVRADYGMIEVSGAERSDALITWEIDYRTEDLDETAKERERIQYNAEIVGSVLDVSLRYKNKSSWRWIFGDESPKIKIKVTLPSKLAVNVATGGGSVDVSGIKGKCIVKTNGGRIALEDIYGDADVVTSGGRIDVENMIGELNAKTSGGAIDIEDVDGRILAKTSGGSIGIEGGKERIIAETTGGSIRLECMDPDIHLVDLNTMGGSISIELDERVGGQIDIKTQGGSVSIDDDVWAFEGEQESNSMKGRFGKGKAVIKGYTLGGSVRVDTI